MKKRIPPAILLVVIMLSKMPVTAQNSSKAIIYGKLIHSSGKVILLQDKPLGAMGKNYKVNDIGSYTPTDNDSIYFTLFINTPVKLSLGIDGKDGWFPFIISPGDSVLINGNGDSFLNWTVKGSYEDSIFKNFVATKIKPIVKKFSGRSISGDSMKYYMGEIYQSQIRFVQNNNNDYAALLVSKDLSMVKDMDSILFEQAKQSYTNLSEKVKRYDIGKDAHHNFFIAPYLYNPGNQISTLPVKTTRGKAFDFKNTLLKNELVLIDFWATWCAPCIAQFPALKKLYTKYNKGGFEIIGISSDVNIKYYDSFIKKYMLPWITLNDGEGTKSAVMKQFQVSAFPTNYLVDSNGKILAINITTDSLEKILSEQIIVNKDLN